MISSIIFAVIHAIAARCRTISILGIAETLFDVLSAVRIIIKTIIR